MPAENIQRLAQQLAQYPEVAEAYLIRKELRYFPDIHLYVLGIVAKQAWYRYRAPSADAALTVRLTRNLVFPGETFVLVLNGNSQMKKVMKEIDGSGVYPL